MESPRRRGLRIVLAVSIAGFAGQGVAILLYSHMYPAWILVFAPIVWAVFCGSVLLQLIRKKSGAD
jgi:hypothetical protein